MSFTVRWPRLLNPTQLAHMIRQQKNPLTALHLFNTAPALYPSYRHNSAAYSAIIAALSAPPLRHPQLLSVLHQMLLDSAPVHDRVLSAAISALPPADALALFRRIPLSNCVSSSSSFHSLLRLLLSHHDLPSARHLLDLISQQPNPAVRLSVRSLNLLIAAMCGIGRIDLAQDIFTEFQEQCCYPDRDTYRLLMQGLCDAGRLDDATHLLYSMLRRISQKGCEADVIVYRMLLDALCADGRVAEAEEILGKVLKKGIRIPRKRRTFRSPEINGGSLEETKRIVDVSLVVGGVRSLASYGAMINDLYAEGKFDDADRMFEGMLKRGFMPTVAMYESKIAALCGAGRADDAVRVLEVEMKERDCVPSVETYNLVMEGLCKEGKSARAVTYLERMDRQVGCVASKETFEILVEGLCCEGQFLEAAAMLERMLRRRHWPPPTVFDSVIRGLCSINRRYEALLWLEEMVSQGKAPEPGLWAALVSMVCFDRQIDSSHWDMLVYELEVPYVSSEPKSK